MLRIKDITKRCLFHLFIIRQVKSIIQNFGSIPTWRMKRVFAFFFSFISFMIVSKGIRGWTFLNKK